MLTRRDIPKSLLGTGVDYCHPLPNSQAFLPDLHPRCHFSVLRRSCRTGLKANLLDRDGDAAYESQGSYCDHDHTTDLDLRAQTEHGLLRSDYYVLPPSWSVRTKELIAQVSLFRLPRVADGCITTLCHFRIFQLPDPCMLLCDA